MVVLIERRAGATVKRPEVPPFERQLRRSERCASEWIEWMERREGGKDAPATAAGRASVVLLEPSSQAPEMADMAAARTALR